MPLFSIPVTFLGYIPGNNFFFSFFFTPSICHQICPTIFLHFFITCMLVDEMEKKSGPKNVSMAKKMWHLRVE